MAYSCRSLKLLRKEGEAFLAAIDSSPAVQAVLSPWLHLLRDLADPRPASQKLHDALARCAVLPSHLHSERERVGKVLNKLEMQLPGLPLSGVPDRKTVRAHLARLDEEKRDIGDTFPHRCSTSAYASTR